VLKYESFDYAFKLLIQEELGLNSVELKFKGIYEHFYGDNFSAHDFTAHYLVLADEITFNGDLALLPLQ